MAAFKDQFESLRAAFLQMPLPTRVIGGSMVVVIAIGLWMLAGGMGSAATTERLFIGEALTDDEITKILAAFSAARLNGWEVKFNHVYVPTAARDEYLRAVQDAGALPLKGESLISAVQKQASALDSDSRRRDMEAHAKERDLGRRIAELPQVLRATVEHDAVRKGFSSQHRQSASVVVVPRGSDPLPGAVIRQIKEMVRFSYAGMTADEVNVTDVNAPGATADDGEDDLFAVRVKWEEHFTRIARQHLKSFGPLSVQAIVEIDPTMDVEKARLAYDSQPTTVQEQSAQTSIESSRPMPGGVPGVASNAYGNKGASIDPSQMQTNRTTKKNEASVKVTGEEYEKLKLAGFQPTRVTFSVGVPQSYYEAVWRSEYLRANPTATSETIPAMTADDRARQKIATSENIKSALSPMLMEVKPGEDQYPLVTIFDLPDLPEPAPREPSTAATALSWLASSWQTLAMFALAITALLMVRGIGKMGASAPRRDFEEGFGLELPRLTEDDLVDETEEVGPKLTITGQHLKQELTELVGTNPEAAANVLRRWLDTPAA